MGSGEVEARAVTLELTNKWVEVRDTCPWLVFDTNFDRKMCIATSCDCLIDRCAIVHFMRGL